MLALPGMPLLLDRRWLASMAMLVALPLLAYYLWICLTFHDGTLAVPTSARDLWSLLARIPPPTVAASVLYVAWLAWQVLLHVVAPGRVVEGPALHDGTRLGYRLNGWCAFWCTWLIIIGVVWLGWLSPTIGYDEFGPLLTAANIFAFVLAAYVYRRGKSRTTAASGWQALHDFVYGASLNPRVRGFDFKFFCEGRPGLMLWVAINVSLAAKQYELHGTVTTPMVLVNVFQFLYVADYFFHEEAILTTWDIRHERFGWILCWGCLVWVPFTFSIQAYYLVTHTHDLPVWATAGIVALNLAGYVIFRGANLQKHRFRRDPSRVVWGRPPQYIRTGSGALLLTSGWWGLARHSNYFGDLLMALAWCLPAGFEHPLPYFYVVYFVILLLHRERRDYARCLQEYGQDWEAYCRKVRWRIVPGLY